MSYRNLYNNMSGVLQQFMVGGGGGIGGRGGGGGKVVCQSQTVTFFDVYKMTQAPSSTSRSFA